MTLNQKDKDEFLNTAIYAAKEASKVILRSNQKTVKTYKAKTDLVTSTDHESERVIIDIIRLPFLCTFGVRSILNSLADYRQKLLATFKIPSKNPLFSTSLYRSLH